MRRNEASLSLLLWWALFFREALLQSAKAFQQTCRKASCCRILEESQTSFSSLVAVGVRSTPSLWGVNTNLDEKNNSWLSVQLKLNTVASFYLSTIILSNNTDVFCANASTSLHLEGAPMKKLCELIEWDELTSTRSLNSTQLISVWSFSFFKPIYTRITAKNLQMLPSEV